jgi:hypothetical protein
VRAQSASSPEGLGALADWGEGPLSEAGGMTPSGAAEQPGRARPAWPRAQPASSPEGLGALADWGEGPLSEAGGMTPSGAAEQPGRARPAWPRGMEGR